jgi:hypothetical protein
MGIREVVTVQNAGTSITSGTLASKRYAILWTPQGFSLTKITFC